MMEETSGRLVSLVRTLDSFESPPSLVQLSTAIKEAKLRIEDVLPYVKEVENTYHRSLVFRCGRFELLVLTWRPGQGSVPHDHSGSVSAMEVIEGTAAEGAWRVADDGYADLEFEAIIKQGECTAWQDAGVHSLRNPSEDKTLVTVNVYAPPLKDFRRFNPRPNGHVAKLERSNQLPTVVIAGGGFSGSMTAAQLIKRANIARFPLHVVLVERQGVIGEGVAYSTRDENHMLNVPAGRMSAWPESPDDFVRWLSKKHTHVLASDFVCRKWYGEYVRETLLTTAQETGGVAKLSILYDEVRRLSKLPLKGDLRENEESAGWMVSFAKNTSIAADSVVLAIGHRSPSDPIGRNWSGSRSRFIDDPWRPFSTNAIASNDSVVVLGTGLTAIDTVLSLCSSPRSAPITLISRRGLLPQVHSWPPVAAIDMTPAVQQLCSKDLVVRSLVRNIRSSIQECLASGGDWRSVVDGLRPHIPLLWRSLSETERQRFLRHVRVFWEVHRHRTAPEVAGLFEAYRKSGLVRVIAGRVAAAQADKKVIRMFVRERGNAMLVELNAAWVINCTGPGVANSPESNPVIGSLLVHDWVKPDSLALGLESTDLGLVLDAEGREAGNLHMVGTLRKPNSWESTAVPELRVQAAQIAESILEKFHSELSSARGSSWSI